jgi:hypothetical protein
MMNITLLSVAMLCRYGESRGATFKECFITLDHGPQILTYAEKESRCKQSSLFVDSVKDGEKRFITLTTARQ